MSVAGPGQRFVLGAFVALAVFAAAAHVLLMLGEPVSEWLAVAAAVPGAIVGLSVRPSPTGAAAAPGWLTGTAAILLLAVTIALIIGSLATPARHWDGAVAWEAKAYWLTVDPTIEQAIFRDAGVFTHSRDYPLLLPLLVATGNRLLGEGMGRLLFPFLYLLLVATVGIALLRRGAGGTVAWLAALAIGLLPVLVSPTSGAVDSGYAEVFLAACLAAVAAGLLLGDRLFLFLGTFLTVLVKPEGLVYAAIAIPILWCRAERSLLRAAVVGWLLGGALLLPLQHDLQLPGDSRSSWGLWGGLLGLSVAVIGSDVFLRRRDVGPRARLWIAIAAFPAVLLALPLLSVGHSDGGSSMAVYLRGISRIPQRVSQLHDVLAGFFHYGFVRMGFGLTFWLLFAAGSWFCLSKTRPAAPRLWTFLLLGLGALLAPFLLSPEADMQHHLRSSMARLQLQWTGVAWILLGVWVAQLRAGESEA